MSLRGPEALREPDMSAVSKITIEPGKRGGKPCIRGLHITIWDVLGWSVKRALRTRFSPSTPTWRKPIFPSIASSPFVSFSGLTNVRTVSLIYAQDSAICQGPKEFELHFDSSNLCGSLQSLRTAVGCQL